MPLNFDLLETNPNDTTGGSGSLASPFKDTDATGPYFLWPATEMDSGASPFVVVAASEVRAMQRALDEYEDGTRQSLSGGEDRTPRGDTTDEVVAEPEAVEDPEVYDLNDPESATDFIAAFTRE